MRNQPQPPAKWTLRDRLLNELYKPVQEQRIEELTSLIQRNCAMNVAQDIADKGAIQPGRTHPSFAFNGRFYSLADAGPPVRNRVHPELMAEVRTHVEFYEHIFTFEQVKIQGYLDSMFSFSASPADWIEVLPDALKPVLRQNILVTDGVEWPLLCTPEQHLAFIDKRRSGFELIRQRLATNLISF